MTRTEADLSAYMAPVQDIIDAVRAEGDEAVARLGRQFDKADVHADRLAATPRDFQKAFATIEPEVHAAIEFAVENIRSFHQEQKPETMWLKEIRPGVFAGERSTAIPSVACYVPRGKGAFPSVTMMTTIPAVVANVPKIVIITPPGPDGMIDDATLVAAAKVGVGEVFKCGGAQGVAAAAFGTDTVPAVAKVIGPGSPYVVAAKRLLADRIDTGLPAGPSEAIVLADGSADGRIAALDLIIESEHGPDSSAFLVTDSEAVAEAAIKALPGFWAELGE
jgi:histidinol dehydrogenase